MSVSIEQLDSVIRSVKGLRRHTHYAGKAKRHRYERRKIRGCIRLGSWEDEDAF